MNDLIKLSCAMSIALQFLDMENIVEMYDYNYSDDGKTVYYRCNADYEDHSIDVSKCSGDIIVTAEIIADDIMRRYK